MSCHTAGVGVRDISEVEFLELLRLEPHGPDTFVGIAANPPWGRRLFGGQIVAQALRAAIHTVDPSRRAHSLDDPDVHLCGLAFMSDAAPSLCVACLAKPMPGSMATVARSTPAAAHASSLCSGKSDVSPRAMAWKRSRVQFP